MQDLVIRKATADDTKTLLEFEQGVIAAERPFDPTLKREATRYYNLDEMIAAPHIELLVAEKDGVLIGSGYVRIEASKPYLQHNRHGYLGFMYVTPEHRGSGVNRSIMHALEAWAIEQGITELRLEVYHENAAAIRAYEKVGFGRHMVEMRKGLESALKH